MLQSKYSPQNHATCRKDILTHITLPILLYSNFLTHITLLKISLPILLYPNFLTHITLPKISLPILLYPNFQYPYYFAHFFTHKTLIKLSFPYYFTQMSLPILHVLYPNFLTNVTLPKPHLPKFPCPYYFSQSSLPIFLYPNFLAHITLNKFPCPYNTVPKFPYSNIHIQIPIPMFPKYKGLMHFV